MLDILFHDEHLVAINKPSGLLVHRSMIDRHETEFALQMTRDQIGQRVYPVHRLDKPTSGILLFALNSEMAKSVNQQFTEQTVQKQYLAVVRGYTEDVGEINHPLTFVLDKIADADAKTDKEAQNAVTHYTTLKQIELPFAVGRYPTSRYSLIACQPKTGRKHQIRRHLKHIFHPIVGDTTYGDGKHNQLFREEFACRRLMLHAQSIKLQHPATLEFLDIKAPLTDDYSVLLEQVFDT